MKAIFSYFLIKRKPNQWNRGFLKVAIVLGLLLLLMVTPISAATTGKIAGTIFDKSSNEPMPGVNVYLEGFPRSEWRNTPDRVSGMGKSGLRVAGAYLLHSQEPGQVFRGDVFISVHENKKRTAPFILKNEGFHHQVFGHPQLPGGHCGAPLLFVLILVKGERYAMIPEETNGLRGGMLFLGHPISRTGTPPSPPVPISRQ